MRLESLHIKNYKLFKDLEIPKLGQVNLITGKNNTGKTILLEALRIWASAGDASVINNIIWKRGGWDESSVKKTYATLFPNQEIYDEARVRINNLDLVAILSEDSNYIETLFALMSGAKKNEKRVDTDRGKKEYPNDSAVVVTASIEFDNTKLWSQIELTDKEDKVVRILKIIEPEIEAIGIINGIARVRTKNSKIPVPLKNFGEGLNRLLTIAMALVSAEDNLLLIDEIDTGLHYSVLEKLWEIIFEFSTQLNSQVFVTTHSGDCVDAFSTVANQERFKGVGNYFRLSRKEEGVVAVEYDIDELEMALESNIETR